jgi:hypothetical protein
VITALPTSGWAQSANSSGIAGVVKDSTGAVLPGVTVEASSPALIEKVRTAVTDGQGQYKLVNLLAGTYTVTFSLPGFATVRQEGVQLQTNFTADVSVAMPVSGVAEAITVTSASPVVDVQNVVQQRVVTAEMIQNLPTGKSEFNLAVIIPGLMIGPTFRASGQDVGGNGAVSPNTTSLHGSKTADSNELLNGLPSNTINAWSTSGMQTDPGIVKEYAYELGSNTVENPTAGVRINWVLRDGGNKYNGMFFTTYGNHALQSDNLTPELQARGLKTVNGTDKIWDLNPSFGGPLRQDKIWFFLSARFWGANDRVTNSWWAKDVTAPVYTPDLSRPAIDGAEMKSATFRPTVRVTPRNTVSAFLFDMGRCFCQNGVSSVVTPDATTQAIHAVNLYGQFTWTSTLTNKLLLQAGTQIYHFDQRFLPQDEIQPSMFSYTETSTGLKYGAAPSYTRHDDRTYNQMLTLSYVTGSHALKTGLSLQSGNRGNDLQVNQSVNLNLLNGQPQSIVQYAAPYFNRKENLNANLGLFIGDQWTLKRLTLNLGLRFDYLHESVPAECYDATPFVASRCFAAVDNVPNYKDLDPRVGMAWDVFGNGKTAIKGSASRYVQGDTLSIATANQPLLTSVNTVTRTWSDKSGTFNPYNDCNLSNPLANGGCGQINNLNFGGSNVTTTYAPGVLTGFGHRISNWEEALTAQQELMSGVSVSAGYTHRSYGNLLVTQNVSAPAGDWTPYCVTAPVDSRLPGGGGYPVCGLYDVNPAQFGKVNNVIDFASKFGGISEVYNGLDLNMNAHLPHQVSLTAGLNSGTSYQTIVGGKISEVYSRTDTCALAQDPSLTWTSNPISSGSAIVTNGGQGQYCKINVPWLTQFKASATVPLPWWGFQTAATYQSMPGPPITAVWAAPNSAIAPSLGRPISAGANGTLPINLVAPATLFEPRLNQIDFRLSKLLNFGRMRAQLNMDLFNALNGSPVLVVNTTYGPNWTQPTYILAGRILKFGAQIDF